MNRIQVWPHLTIIAIVGALVGGVAAALWLRHEPSAEAFTVPRAARIERVEGEVGLDRSFDAGGADWLAATPNTPLTAGDRLYAGDDSIAAVEFTGRNFARLEPDTSLDVLELSDRRTQLALRAGSAIFDLGSLDSGELYEVATPYGAVELREPGLYHLGLNDNGGGAFVSVLSGLAQVVGLAGSGEVSKGEMLTLLGQTAAEIALSRFSPDYAGGLLDDYYGYRYPDAYDGRYSDYNAYLEDPFYYDPSRRHASYRYVPEAIPGAWELDRYGDWQEVGDYGHAWRPRVEPGWAPYQQGYWTLDEPHGLTWVSSEPWGYAPYHYGRWTNVDGSWYWVPESVDARPAYAPALVAFIPPTQGDQIAWVPLAPGDPYAPAYYDSEWRPHYADGSRAVLERVINYGVPGALTVVPAEYFGREIDRGVLVAARPEMFERSRPVLDPFSVAVLRQAALERAISRRGFVLPPGLAKRLDETQVYTSARSQAPPFKGERARVARVEVVSDTQKEQKLKFKDERTEEVAREPHGARPFAAQRDRGRQASLEAEAAKGDKEARRQLKQLERQDTVRRNDDRGRHEGAARALDERALGKAERQAQGERVGAGPQPPKPPKHEARPHQPPGGGGGGMKRQRGGGGNPQPQAVFTQPQSQPKAERRQGPPAHAAGGGGGAPHQAQGNPGKGKGKGKP